MKIAAVILIFQVAFTFGATNHKHNHVHNGEPKKTLNEVVDELQKSCPHHFTVIQAIAERNKNDQPTIVEGITKELDAARIQTQSVVDEIKTLMKTETLTLAKWNEEITKYIKIIQKLHYDILVLKEQLPKESIADIETEFTELSQHIQEIKENGKTLIDAQD